MKQYVAPKHLRLVGKGWEIRHQLRKLSSASNGRREAIADFTKTMPSLKRK